MYYVYTVKLGLDEDSFFKSTLARVLYLIDKWTDEKKMEAAAFSGKPIPEPPKTVRSLKEVLRNYGQ